MDIILSADVRHSLTECMTDVYLLAWDIFYQKFGGESIQEDMTRIRIYVNGNPNYLKESIHGDLGPTCDLFEQIKPSSSKVLSERYSIRECDYLPLVPLNQEGSRNHVSVYYFASIVHQIGNRHPPQSPMISRFHMDKLQIYLSNFRACAIALRHSRNCNQHRPGAFSTASVQGISSALIMCELYEDIFQLLKETSYESVLSKNDIRHVNDSELIKGLHDLLKDDVSRYISSTSIDSTASIRSANEQELEHVSPGIRDLHNKIDLIQEDINNNTSKVKNQYEVISENIHRLNETVEKLNILTIDQPIKGTNSLVVSSQITPESTADKGKENRNITAPIAMRLTKGILRRISNIRKKDFNRLFTAHNEIQHINKLPGNKEAEAKVLEMRQDITETSEQLTRQQAERKLLNMRQEIQDKMITIFPEFKAFHNILQSGAVRNALDNGVTSSEGYMSIPQIKRIIDMNPGDGDRMVGEQFSNFEQTIFSILSRVNWDEQLDDDEDDDVPF